MAKDPGAIIIDDSNEPRNEVAGDKPVEPPSNPGSNNGDPKHEARTSEPEIIHGYEAISPFDFSDSSTGTGSSGTATPRSGRRGRPPGTKNRSTVEREAQKNSTNLGDLSSVLFSAHYMLAKLVNVAEFELDEAEAKKLSDALGNVAKHYNFAIDPKTLAMIQLTFVAGEIYGTRAVAFYKRKVTEDRPAQPLPAPPTPIRMQPKSQANGAPPIPVKPVNVDLSRTTPSQLWNQSINDED